MVLPLSEIPFQICCRFITATDNLSDLNNIFNSKKFNNALKELDEADFAAIKETYKWHRKNINGA